MAGHDAMKELQYVQRELRGVPGKHGVAEMAEEHGKKD